MLVLFLYGYGIIYLTKTNDSKETSKILTKCPEDYPNTEAGIEAKEISVDEWIADFRKDNPNASLADFAKGRYRFYFENDCSAILEKYFEMEQNEAETIEEKILRETIQEEIYKQATKNLFQALKEDKEKNGKQ